MVHVVHVCAVFLRGGLLLHGWELVFPFADAFGANRGGALVGALGCCGFGGGEGGGRGGSAVGDAAACGGFGVGLVLLVGVGGGGGGDPVVEDRAHLGVRAVPAAKRRDWSWTAWRWWPAQSVRWCGREDVPCGAAVVGI